MTRTLPCPYFLILYVGYNGKTHRNFFKALNFFIESNILLIELTLTSVRSVQQLIRNIKFVGINVVFAHN